MCLLCPTSSKFSSRMAKPSLSSTTTKQLSRLVDRSLIALFGCSFIHSIIHSCIQLYIHAFMSLFNFTHDNKTTFKVGESFINIFEC